MPYVDVPERRARRGMLLTVALVLVVVAFIMLLVGFVAPGWTFIHVNSDNHSSTGLWYTVLCVLGSCNSDALGKIDSYIKVQATATVSFVFAIASIVLVAIIRRPTVNWLKAIAACCVFIAGLFAIVAAAIHGDDLRKAEDRITGKNFDFPYALFLFGLGGVILLIAFVLIIVDMYQGRPHEVYEKRSYIQERPVAPEPYPVQYQDNRYPVQYQSYHEPQHGYTVSQYDPQVIRTSHLRSQPQIVYTQSHAPVHYGYSSKPRYYDYQYSSRASRSSRNPEYVSMGGL